MSLASINALLKGEQATAVDYTSATAWCIQMEVEGKKGCVDQADVITLQGISSATGICSQTVGTCG